MIDSSLVHAIADSLDVLHVVEATNAGVRRHVIDLAHGLAAEGVSQCVAFSPARADQGWWKGLDQLSRRGVDFRSMNIKRNISPFADWRALVDLGRIINETNPRILHLHSSKAGGLGRIAALGRPQLRVVYTPNASAAEQSVSYRIIESVLGWLRTDSLIAVSPSERSTLARLRIAPDRSLVTVYSGIDHDELSAQVDYPTLQRHPGRIVTAGRIEQQKNPELFAAVAERVCERLQGASFMWVGDGSMRGWLEHRLARMIEAQRVIVTGWQDSAAPLIASGSVFFLPSAFESFGYVTLEAMSLGVPVVATRVAGSLDLVVDGETGYLVSSAAEAEGAITTLLNDHDRRIRLGAAGRSRALRFSREAMAKETRQVYSMTGRLR